MQNGKKKTVLKSLPSLVGSGSFHIEIDRCEGGFSVIVHGVSGISEFSHSLAVLSINRGSVIISGSDLSVAVYEGMAAEICGGVFDVRLEFKN